MTVETSHAALWKAVERVGELEKELEVLQADRIEQLTKFALGEGEAEPGDKPPAIISVTERRLREQKQLVAQLATTHRANVKALYMSQWQETKTTRQRLDHEIAALRHEQEPIRGELFALEAKIAGLTEELNRQIMIGPKELRQQAALQGNVAGLKEQVMGVECTLLPGEFTKAMAELETDRAQHGNGRAVIVSARIRYDATTGLMTAAELVRVDDPDAIVEHGTDALSGLGHGMPYRVPMPVSVDPLDVARGSPPGRVAVTGTPAVTSVGGSPLKP